MTAPLFDIIVGPLARRLQEKHMYRLGIAEYHGPGHAYNKLRFGRQDKRRRHLYRTELSTTGRKWSFPSARQSRCATVGHRSSRSLPHLDRILADADEIIAERRRRTPIGRGNLPQLFPGHVDSWLMPNDIRLSSTSPLRPMSGGRQPLPRVHTNPFDHSAVRGPLRRI